MWVSKIMRLWYRRQCRDPALREFLSGDWPGGQRRVEQVSFLAVDLETTDLDPMKGEVASIAWVPIDNGLIRLAGAEYYQLQLAQGVGQSAIYHHLHDDELAQGLKVTEVIKQLLRAAKGRVLVFHHAGLDMGFLNLLCRRLYGVPMVAPVVDTLLLEKRKYLRHNAVIEPSVLRLFSCRQRYGLPDYPAHDALVDAIAAAELLLAYIAHRGDRVCLGELL